MARELFSQRSQDRVLPRATGCRRASTLAPCPLAGGSVGEAPMESRAGPETADVTRGNVDGPRRIWASLVGTYGLSRAHRLRQRDTRALPRRTREQSLKPNQLDQVVRRAE